jgi:transcriptional regulator with XRE-family HTH domain
MKSLLELAELLRARLKAQGVSQRVLGARAGLARRTLENMLSGRVDYKVTTLISVLDRLGLELVVVPKEAAPGLADLVPNTPAQPAVKTRLQAAREALQARLVAEPPPARAPTRPASPRRPVPTPRQPGGKS